MHSDIQHIPVSDIDVNHMMYGNFIGVIYLFEIRLDETVLASAWEELQRQLPVVTGRYSAKTQSLIPSQLGVLQSRNSPNHLNDVRQSDRNNYISEPDRRIVLAGKAPLASLTLTHLDKNGSVLGLAINHVITDAGGFHKIAKYLGEIYTAFAQGKPAPMASFVTSLPEFTFGTKKDWVETRDELSRQDLKPPLPLTGAKGWLPRNLVLWAMKKISTQRRLRISLTSKQVDQLKQTALEESGEDWISTNAALCAHFASIMIDLIHDGTPKKPLRIGQLLDLRHRYFEDSENQQGDFIGNAILIHTQQTQLQDYSRGALTRFFKSMVSGLSAEFITTRLNVIADSLRNGRTYPGLEMSDPLLAVNNQTKMLAYAIDFNSFSPIDIIPQDVGDNIMFFPAKEGGVDVYIRDILNPKRQAKLESPSWQARIFDF